jgi:hypothetical protein
VLARAQQDARASVPTGMVGRRCASAVGGYLPQSNWLHQPDASVYIDRSVYEHIRAATLNRVISHTVATEWFDKCFRGLYPDWLYTLAVNDTASPIWSAFHESVLLPCAAPVCGLIQFDSVIKRGRLTDITWDKVYSGVVQFCNMEHADPEQADELGRSIEAVYPFTDQGVLSRSRLRGKLLVLILRECTKTAELRVGRISSWFRATVGMGFQALAGLVLFGVSSDECASIADYIVRAGWWRGELSRTIEILGAVHDVVRRAKVVPNFFRGMNNVGYQNFMYLKLLTGRFFFPEIADDGTVAQRATVGNTMLALDCTGNWSEGAFDELLLKHLDAPTTFFAEAVHRADIPGPATLRSKLLNIATQGSASSGWREAEPVYGKMSGTYTKMMWLATLSDEQIESAIHRRPEIRTTAVVKREPGKLRQLLPGPVWHWLVESMAMYAGERAIFRRSEEMALEESALEEFTRVTTMMADSMRDDLTILCLDHKDFNRIHKVKSMAAMWNAIANKCRAGDCCSAPGWDGMTCSYPVFVAKCCEWLAVSLHNMWARADLSNSGFTKLVRGLWSGWRSTSMINNTFNLVYLRMAEETYIQLYGTKPLALARTMGDDGTAHLVSEYDALNFTCLMQHMGFELNASKQMVAQGTSEFLRVTYEDGSASSPIARAVSSYVGADMQAPAASSSAFYARGCCDAASNLGRRGANAARVSAIARASARYWSTKRVRIPATDREREVSEQQMRQAIFAGDFPMDRRRVVMAPPLSGKSTLAARLHMPDALLDIDDVLIQNGFSPATWHTSKLTAAAACDVVRERLSAFNGTLLTGQVDVRMWAVVHRWANEIVMLQLPQSRLLEHAKSASTYGGEARLGYARAAVRWVTAHFGGCTLLHSLEECVHTRAVFDLNAQRVSGQLTRDAEYKVVSPCDDLLFGSTQDNGIGCFCWPDLPRRMNTSFPASEATHFLAKLETKVDYVLPWVQATVDKFSERLKKHNVRPNKETLSQLRNVVENAIAAGQGSSSNTLNIANQQFAARKEFEWIQRCNMLSSAGQVHKVEQTSNTWAKSWVAENASHVIGRIRNLNKSDHLMCEDVVSTVELMRTITAGPGACDPRSLTGLLDSNGTALTELEVVGLVAPSSTIEIFTHATRLLGADSIQTILRGAKSAAHEGLALVPPPLRAATNFIVNVGLLHWSKASVAGSLRCQEVMSTYSQLSYWAAQFMSQHLLCTAMKV